MYIIFVRNFSAIGQVVGFIISERLVYALRARSFNYHRD